METLNAQEFAMIMNEAVINSDIPEYDFASLVPDWVFFYTFLLEHFGQLEQPQQGCSPVLG